MKFDKSGLYHVIIHSLWYNIQSLTELYFAGKSILSDEALATSYTLILDETKQVYNFAKDNKRIFDGDDLYEIDNALDAIDEIIIKIQKSICP